MIKILITEQIEFYIEFQKDTISINHNWFNGYNLSWAVSKQLLTYAIEK